MKKFANEYSYERIYSFDEETKKSNYINSKLMSHLNNRKYKTKMTVLDLPEDYCDVTRYYTIHNCIKSSGIMDMKYTWVKENHFMKDSVLRISFSGKLNTYYPIYEYDGKLIESRFLEYENLDSMVFGFDIFKYLGYAKKYSNYDLTEIRDEFIKHCQWLSENEPEFCPTTSDFGDYFDNNINKNL